MWYDLSPCDVQLEQCIGYNDPQCPTDLCLICCITTPVRSAGG